MSTAIVLLAFLTGDEAATTAALDKFKTDYKAKEAATRAGAVTELARTQDDKIYAKLGQLLVVDANEVRIAAAKGLALVTENRKKAAIYLANGLAPNQKEPMVAAAILEALGKVKESPAPETVAKFLKTRNTPICKAAVEAAGEIGSRFTVPALIDCLKWLEENAKDAPATGGGGAGYAGLGGGGGTAADPESKDRERVVRPICLKALQTITKSSNSSAKEWESWMKSSEGARFLRGEK